MTESLMFFMFETRTNIVFATSIVSRFAKNPFYQYAKAVKIIIRYLKAIRSIGITYSKKEGEGEDLTIKRYSDSDWASNHVTKHELLNLFLY